MRQKGTQIHVLVVDVLLDFLDPSCHLFRGLGLEDQAEIGLGVGLADVEPPVLEVEAVAIEIQDLVGLGCVGIVQGLDDLVLFLKAEVDFAAGRPFDDFLHQVARALSFLLCLAEDRQQVQRGEARAVAVEEVAEIVMPGKLTAINGPDFTDFCLGVDVSYLP